MSDSATVVDDRVISPEDPLRLREYSDGDIMLYRQQGDQEILLETHLAEAFAQAWEAKFGDTPPSQQANFWNEVNLGHDSLGDEYTANIYGTGNASIVNEDADRRVGVKHREAAALVAEVL